MHLPNHVSDRPVGSHFRSFVPLFLGRPGTITISFLFLVPLLFEYARRGLKQVRQASSCPGMRWFEMVSLIQDRRNLVVDVDIRNPGQ
jgi:hypothetical protein